MKKIFQASLCSLLIMLSFSQVANAEISVVVNSENSDDLDKEKIRRIFLGKSKSFANGNKVETFDLPEGNRTREEFRELVLRKSDARLSSHWARMLFSSKAQPPKVLADADAIKEVVSSNPNAIAYMDSADVDASVKVIFKIR